MEKLSLWTVDPQAATLSRHGYARKHINGWDPNASESWVESLPEDEFPEEAVPCCDALITHVTDFGAIGIDLFIAHPIFICDAGIKKRSVQQAWGPLHVL